MTFQIVLLTLQNRFFKMLVTFKEAYLRELYFEGRCSDKKHRYDASTIKSYRRGIEYLRYAERKEHLFPINSLNFEALKGDKKGLYSIRAGRKYRIEFSIEENETDLSLSICDIVELSNHYD